MNWAPIYSALAQAAALTGIPASSIGWAGQPANADWTMGASLSMQIRDLHALGFDDEERTDNAPANQTVTVVGQRQFTWSIWCQIQNSDPATIGISYLDKLRARLARTTTEQEILLPAGLAVVEIHPTQSLASIQAARKVSYYVMEVTMACAENDVDASANAGEYIASVGISSNKLQLSNGDDAPEQIAETIGP